MKPFHKKTHDMELGCFIDYQGVIQLRIAGNVSSDYEELLLGWIESVKTAMRLSKKRDSDPVLCLINVTSPEIDVDLRSLKLLTKLIRYNRDYATRTGVYGIYLIPRNLIDIALKATDRKNFKMFVTRKEAEDWVFRGKIKKIKKSK